MNTRERVLKEALNCVNGEREKQYGSPEDNFRRIADLWSTYLTSLFEDEKVVVDIDPIDVAKMMILFKIARSNGDQDKMDNYVDMIGYASCAAEIFESSEKAEQVLKKKEELGVQLADECKDCDYAEKCIGTGVCLKDTEKKCIKDKPDEKCNRKDCGQFDACMTAYQHYIYNKTKEASETIDKCCICGQVKGGRIYFNSKISDNNKDVYRNGFNEAAEQMILKLKEDKKITRAVDVPEGFNISSIYMTEAGQIIARFNPIREETK